MANAERPAFNARRRAVHKVVVCRRPE